LAHRSRVPGWPLSPMANGAGSVRLAGKTAAFLERTIFVTGGSTQMNIRPLYDRLVVERVEEQETMAGGLYIPDSAKEKPQEGKVIAVGKGKRLEDGKVVPLDVQAGDRILFGKYSGNEIKIDGNEYLIMREDEVLGVIEKNGAAPSKKK
jgi:chaperonin GroES